MIETDLLTLSEASGYLKVARSTLILWTQQGRLPSYKLGKCRRFKRSELDRFVEDSAVVPKGVIDGLKKRKLGECQVEEEE